MQKKKTQEKPVKGQTKKNSRSISSFFESAEKTSNSNKKPRTEAEPKPKPPKAKPTGSAKATEAKTPARKKSISEDVPTEVLSMILYLVPVGELIRSVTLTCKKFKEIVESKDFARYKKAYYLYMSGKAFKLESGVSRVFGATTEEFYKERNSFRLGMESKGVANLVSDELARFDKLMKSNLSQEIQNIENKSEEALSKSVSYYTNLLFRETGIIEYAKEVKKNFYGTSEVCDSKSDEFDLNTMSARLKDAMRLSKTSIGLASSILAAIISIVDIKGGILGFCAPKMCEVLIRRKAFIREVICELFYLVLCLFFQDSDGLDHVKTCLLKSMVEELEDPLAFVYEEKSPEPPREENRPEPESFSSTLIDDKKKKKKKSITTTELGRVMKSSGRDIKARNYLAKISLTEEQRSVVNYDLAPGQKVKVVALAGTGKSSMLAAYSSARRSMKILYLVFNTDMRDSAENIFPLNTDCKTIHSLAYGAYIREIKKSFGSKAEVSPTLKVTGKTLQETMVPEFWLKSISVSATPSQEDKRVLAFQKEKMPDMPDIPNFLKVYIRDKEAEIVAMTINNYFNSEDIELSESHVQITARSDDTGGAGDDDEDDDTFKGSDLCKYMVYKCKKVLSVIFCKSPTHYPEISKYYKSYSTPPISHDGYLKLYQLSAPDLSTRYDLVMVDEAQDLNPCCVSILGNQSRVRMILVGDENQQIYSFRGSSNSMASIPTSKTFGLTASFRFGKMISLFSNAILEASSSTGAKIRGIKNYDEVTSVDKRGIPQYKHTYIGKTRASLLSYGIWYQNQKHGGGQQGTPKYPQKRIAVVGLERFLQLARKLCEIRQNPLEAPAGTIEAEVATVFDSDGPLDRSVWSYGEDGFEIGSVQSDAAALASAVVEYNPKEKETYDLVLCTIHKSKGMEWDNVMVDSNSFEWANILIYSIKKKLKDLKGEELKRRLVGIKYPRLADQTPVHDLEAHMQISPKEERKFVESANLQYVAFTRARKRLILREFTHGMLLKIISIQQDNSLSS